MKRFRFRLEKLLELRLYREKDAELALARAAGELDALQRRIEAVAAERVSVAADRFAPGRSVAEIRNAELYMLRLERNAEALMKAAATAELAVEQAQDAFVEARKERAVLDKLKERRAAEHRKASMVEEIAVLDDIAGSRSARRASGT